ncbi:hypothetical protein HW35_14495 [Bacillus sp. X1(2014)]|nr:hypothetical protein HW35_14495 [Bacillus sp. X1(2014)]
MDVEITKLSGESFRLSERDITVRDFVVGSPTINRMGDTGSSGSSAFVRNAGWTTQNIIVSRSRYSRCNRKQ